MRFTGIWIQSEFLDPCTGTRGQWLAGDTPTPTLGRAWSAGHAGPSDPGLWPQASLILDLYCVILMTASFQTPGLQTVPGHISVILNHQRCVCARRHTLRDTTTHSHRHCRAHSWASHLRLNYPLWKPTWSSCLQSCEAWTSSSQRPPPPRPFLSPAPREWTPRRPPEGADVLHSHHLPADRHTGSSSAHWPTFTTIGDSHCTCS